MSMVDVPSILPDAPQADDEPRSSDASLRLSVGSTTSQDTQRSQRRKGILDSAFVVVRNTFIDLVDDDKPAERNRGRRSSSWSPLERRDSSRSDLSELVGAESQDAMQDEEAPIETWGPLRTAFCSLTAPFGTRLAPVPEKSGPLELEADQRLSNSTSASTAFGITVQEESDSRSRAQIEPAFQYSFGRFSEQFQKHFATGQVAPETGDRNGQVNTPPTPNSGTPPTPRSGSDRSGGPALLQRSNSERSNISQASRRTPRWADLADESPEPPPTAPSQWFRPWLSWASWERVQQDQKPEQETSQKEQTETQEQNGTHAEQDFSTNSSSSYLPQPFTWSLSQQQFVPSQPSTQSPMLWQQVALTQNVIQVYPSVATEEESSPINYAFSEGSRFHASGTCTPCKFLTSKKGCARGTSCTFCHLAHLKKVTSWPLKSTREKYAKAVSRVESEEERQQLVEELASQRPQAGKFLGTLLRPPSPVNKPADGSQDGASASDCSTPTTRRQAHAERDDSTISEHRDVLSSSPISSNMDDGYRLLTPEEKEEAHRSGRCRPCAYFNFKSDGCDQGDFCKFCHICTLEEVKNRKRDYKKEVRRIKRRSQASKLANGNTSLDDDEAFED